MRRTSICVAVLGMAVSGCEPGAPGGFASGVVARQAAASFDAEVAPYLSGACAPAEIATLRSVSVDTPVVINSGNLGAVQAIGAQLQSLSPGCQQAFRQRSADLCARSAIRDAPPGTPSDLIRARAQECYR